MIDGLKLELKDAGPIVSADIDINRINIVGGPNATGKSTASKLLYCFLKINSSDRDRLVSRRLNRLLRDIDMTFKFYSNDEDVDIDELKHHIRKMRHLLRSQDYDDFEEIIDLFYKTQPLFSEAIENCKFYRVSTGEIEISDMGVRLIREFNKVERILKSVVDGSSYFYKEVMKDLLSTELDINGIDDKSAKNSDFYMNYACFSDSPKSNFSFEVKPNDTGNELESEGKFNISNVFYIESFSIFDKFNPFSSTETFHTKDLKDNLFLINPISRSFDDESIKKLEEIVDKVIGGRILKDKRGELYFASNDSNYTSSMKNTASGIKQIAVIQTLLHNRFLGEECVLIMDEPEVNLHPEWQIKLARILVLLAKEGNITLYINTHSPMLIEAIDTFCEYYDFEEYVNYYLSRKLGDDEIKTEEDKTKAKFERIPSDELYIIYENLGDPFDYLDQVRLSKGRKEGFDDLDF